jgi:hypothetical protein
MRRIILLALIGCGALSAAAAHKSLAAEPIDYLRDVKPILVARCYACHGPLKQKGELRLDRAKSLSKGGESGPAVVASDVDKSLLIDVLTGDAGFRMPPEGKPLEPAQIDVIRKWIQQGAKAPQSEQPAGSPLDHWSFRQPTRPAVPRVKDASRVRNPIDAFIAVEREKRKLKPHDEAAKPVLLRRVYLDLIGLPPTREELHAFLADDLSDAYEKVVDRLLKSPRYGERWGRHWMDVWRYSDWYGRRASGEIRYSQRHIWRWRDWIIESVNADKGYDRMIVEMLAGDEVAPGDEDVLRATGFLGRNWYKFDRNVWLRETVEHTSMGFLGVTLKCARCHDHKFDPIDQKEYYRFRAFFEPHSVRIDPVAGQPDPLKGGLPRAFDEKPDAPTYFFVRGDDRLAEKDKPLSVGVPAALGNTSIKVTTVTLSPLDYYPALRPSVIEGSLATADQVIKTAEAALAKADAATKPLAEKQLLAAQAQRVSLSTRIAAEKAKYATPPAPNVESLALAAGKAEREATFATADVGILTAESELAKAKATAKPDDKKAMATVTAAEKKLATARKAHETALAALEKPNAAYNPLGTVYGKTSTGRRLALARWITNTKNPRTSRVAVNHIWMRHFGQALVPSVANFGLAGKAPSHPNLLDWLASELVENRWSMKHLHRLMVTSNTYRLKSTISTADRSNVKIDASNRYFWRMNSRRMEAEVVRDSLLRLADTLDITMGGPELDPKLGQTSKRRSLYFRITPDDKMEMLDLFDLANPSECYERKNSVVPQQSLALFNSVLAADQARIIARSLTKPVGTSPLGDATFVTMAFQQVLTRSPTSAEKTRLVQFLTTHTALLRKSKTLATFPADGVKRIAPSTDPVMRARENLVHVLLNHNDFVTIR